MKNFNKLLIFLSYKNIHLGSILTVKCADPNIPYESVYTFKNINETVKVIIKVTIFDEVGNYDLNTSIKFKGHKYLTIRSVDEIETLTFIKNSFFWNIKNNLKISSKTFSGFEKLLYIYTIK
jgi:hypothetical protein